jgi:hypothetical protein
VANSKTNLTIKRYFNLDEALEFLSKSLSRPFSNADLVDLALIGSLTVCFPLKSSVVPIDSEIGEEYFEASFYFHGYASFRKRDFSIDGELPSRSWMPSTYENLNNSNVCLFSEAQKKFVEPVGFCRFIYSGGRDEQPEPSDVRPISVERAQLRFPSNELEALVAAHTRQNSNEVNIETFFSKDLRALNQAARIFWRLVDRGDKTTHPKTESIEEWLVKEGFSKTLASKGATIIRPEWAESGRPLEK